MQFTPCQKIDGNQSCEYFDREGWDKNALKLAK